MKRLKSKSRIFLILSFFLFLCPLIVNATGNATTGFSGNGSVYIGNNIDITLYVNSVSETGGGLAAFGGNINYSSDKLDLVGVVSQAPFNVDLVGSKLGGFGANTINGYQNIMKFTFRAKATGSATISYTGSSQPDANASPVNISGCSKTIQINDPPSSNNNLSSLSVNNANISFNKNNTNYNLTVDSNVTSTTISASAEDGKASVSGQGNKSLSYGNNTFYITVTAPSGAKKTYTININRRDNRSGNNKLSKLTVNGGELSPAFSSNTDDYNLSVPYSVSNLNVKAEAQDSKAKVSISGQNNLVAEETTDVKITVTAENGSSRVYTIHVKRGKDPNKILSTNNYLSSLTVSTGILSPSFDKEKENYVVYLPYEVDTISVDATLEDTRYGSIDKTGPEKLSVGSNEYLLKVKAEDESIRTYKVTVIRAQSIEDGKNNSSNYLKSINIKNGKLLEIFNKKNFIYTYKGNKNIKIDAIKEDENSNVKVFQIEDYYVIVVESTIGNQNVYLLKPSSTINYNMIIIITIIVIVLSIGGTYMVKTNKTKKDKNNVKPVKEKKKNKKSKDIKNDE